MKIYTPLDEGFSNQTPLNGDEMSGEVNPFIQILYDFSSHIFITHEEVVAIIRRQFCPSFRISLKGISWNLL